MNVPPPPDKCLPPQPHVAYSTPKAAIVASAFALNPSQEGCRTAAGQNLEMQLKADTKERKREDCQGAKAAVRGGRVSDETPSRRTNQRNDPDL